VFFVADNKFETRISKYETKKAKRKTSKLQNQKTTALFLSLTFDHFCFEFVSNFDIRISCFSGFSGLGVDQ